MNETGWEFELRFTDDKSVDPDRSYMIHRSDDATRNGGCIYVSSLRTPAKTEVSYSDLSGTSTHDVLLGGRPIVRIRRAPNGNIIGEWVRSATVRSAGLPPEAEQPVPANQDTATSSSGDALASAFQAAGALLSRSAASRLPAAASVSGEALTSAFRVAGGLLNRSAASRFPAVTSVSGETLTSAFRLAGVLLSKSSGSRLQALGSLLSNVSQEMSKSSASTIAAREVPATGLQGNDLRSSEYHPHASPPDNSGPGHAAARATTSGTDKAVAVHPRPAEISIHRAWQGEDREMQNIEVQPEMLKQRIARCRDTIQHAVRDTQGTAEFEKRIIQFYTVAGRSEVEAVEQASTVRAYIEAVPELLERLLQSAQQPDVPDIWVTRQLTLLKAALDAFESSSVVPARFGLAGLLDNPYVATRLLPEEFQVQLDHDLAIQVLGPLTILQLNHHVSEIRLALSTGAWTAEGTAADAAVSVNASVRHGACVDCVHVRYGAPVAQAVFDNLLDAVRASARQAYSQKLRDEREPSSHFVDELEALKRGRDLYYTRRPTERRIMYCGVGEFDGVHQCCEVKNLDNQCEQFQAKPASQSMRACENCRHNYRLPPAMFHKLQQVAAHIETGQDTNNATGGKRATMRMSRTSPQCSRGSMRMPSGHGRTYRIRQYLKSTPSDTAIGCEKLPLTPTPT